MKTIARLLVVLSVSACASAPVDTASTQRQREVALRGAQVMPFDLDKTRHVFIKSASGGIQRVIALDANDRRQIALIRRHLADMGDRFKHRDFSGPAEIHGDEMPGLAALRHAPQQRLKIRYGELENGAELSYETDEPEVLRATHAWFDAQLADHGPHATATCPLHSGHGPP